MERRLAAILLTDMVGYSRLIGLDEEGTIARQRAHREDVFDPKIAEHGGRIVKSTGDGLLIEFASVVDAVKCAIEVQRELADRDADVPEDWRIHYRIGINLGDIVIDGDDILGDGVNVAARLEGLADPGGVCISGTVHDHLAGKVDVVFEHAGEQTVKNVPRPVRVWHWQSGKAVRSPSDINEPPAIPDKPSIAVLAFDNMSGDPAHEFFAVGIAEEIITALSKVSALRVIARNSTFAYKGQSLDLRRVGDELGVRYVLEGSVRRGGERIRVTAQLIDASDGSPLWADRYDRVLDDIFDIQDQITKEIVTALRVQLTDGEEALIWARGTNNVAAWQLCVPATELFLRFHPADYLEARALAEKSIELDPNDGSGPLSTVTARSRPGV